VVEGMILRKTLLAILVIVSMLLLIGAILQVQRILPSPSGPITITAVGDSIGYKIRMQDLENLTEITGKPDVFLFNLEGVLRRSGDLPLNCEGFPSVQSVLTTDQSFVRYMKLAPVTIANMANNHVLDCGAQGIEQTKNILSQNGIFSVGAGLNLSEACEPLRVQVKGWRIVFVSYDFVLTELVSATSDGAGAATLAGCQQNLLKIRSDNVDLLVVSIHYGIWSSEVTQDQIDLVIRLLDAGADLVIGHSPHIPQAVIAKNGKLAFFSLGNFIFRPDYRMPSSAYTSIVPQITFFRDRVYVSIHPIIIDYNGIPSLDHGNTTIRKIAEASKALDTIFEITGNTGELSIARYTSTTAWSARLIQWRNEQRCHSTARCSGQL
jgi:poly-gamma-glutamate synthesis protein (capsule biosynthesis protein)